MTAFLPSLKEKMQYTLQFLPELIFGIYFLVIFIRAFNRLEKGKIKIGKILILLFVFVMSVTFMFAFMDNAGITAFVMYQDYRNCDFSFFSGTIQEVEYSKAMSKGGAVIDGEKFLASLSMQSDFRHYIGDKCEIVYATRSKYVVSCRILSND